MSDREIGARVWAIQHADPETVHAFGFGVYVGRYPRPGTEAGPGAGTIEMISDIIRERDADGSRLDFAHAACAERVARGEMTQAEADEVIAGAVERDQAEKARPMRDRAMTVWLRSMENPKIVLDDGRGVVWGCECWWGPADDETAEKYAKGRRIVLVDPPHSATDEDTIQREAAAATPATTRVRW